MALSAGVRSFMWALGAPPAARVARVTPLQAAFKARRSPLPSFPFSVPGSATHCCRVCGCGGPVLFPWLACPVGAACRVDGGEPSPGGGGPPALLRASGVRRGPSPGCPSSEAGGQSSATRVSWVPSVRAWGPSTGPTACALQGRRGARGGGGRVSPRGGALRRREGRLMAGAPPPLAALPLDGLSGSAIHVLWARVCGCAGPALSPCLACPVGAVCRGGSGGPSPGGGGLSRL